MSKGVNCLAEIVIKAINLTKTYNDFTAVGGIDFNIYKGECFGFLGPNGAGKTTTIKMIYCYLPPSNGKLEVLGWDVNEDAPQIKSKLGVVAQEDNIDKELSVWDNLMVYAAYFGLKGKRAEEKVEELLVFTELAEKKDSPAKELSGGLKRRLSFARALVNDPLILILDEPTTGLDPQVRQLVWQKLRQLKRNGVTLVITTHYLDEAAYLCDRLVLMNEGRILIEGVPEELVQKHITGKVLEIEFKTDKINSFLQGIRPWLKDYLVLGSTVYLYPQNIEALMNYLSEHVEIIEHQLLRNADLEDVYLKFSGAKWQE
jgi:lipooligosaccharide transport system ATP-binding protein